MTLIYRLSISLIWHDCQYRFFLPLFRSPYRIQTQSLLYTPLFLQSRTCNRFSLPPKVYETPLSCHFSERAHCNSTLQQELVAITNFQKAGPRIIFNVHLSPTQSSRIKILFRSVGLTCLPNNY